MPTMPASSPALNPGVKKREVFAWAMYDFANSGYTTVVLTAVFNAYFVSVVAAKAEWATFAWTATLAVSYLAVMFAGPLIGAYADAHAAKKRVLFIATSGCVITTALLYFAGPGDLVLAIVCIIISNFCYAIGENITAAFLPELSTPESLGKVSGWGWSWGYVGGLFALGLCLAWIMSAESRGQKTTDAIAVTMLITAAVYALGASITFIWLKERAVPVAANDERDKESAIARLLRSAREASRYRDLMLVFACGVCYQAGVATVITLAADAGAGGQCHRLHRRLRLRLFAGHHRQEARTGDHAGRLDGDGRLRLVRRHAAAVLGRRQPRRHLHGFQPIGGPRAGGVFLASGAGGGIFRAMGRGHALGRCVRAVDLRLRDLGERQ